MNKPTIISIANQKGGVGKTTTALNIAAGLVKEGKKVMLIDLDPQGNLTDYLGDEDSMGRTICDLMRMVVNGDEINPKEYIKTNSEGIDYIPSNITLSSAEIFLATAFCREQVLSQIIHHESLTCYDYIIIDCLPSLGVLLTNALTASDKVIIPVQAQKFAVDGLSILLSVIKKVKSQINPNLEISGMLLTIVENTIMSKEIENSLRDAFGPLVFKTVISKSINAAYSTSYKKSLIEMKEPKLGEQYKKVVKELIEKQ